MALDYEQIKPQIGAILRPDRALLRDKDYAQACAKLLDERGVLVFPQIAVSDDEQLAFTELLGPVVNFSAAVPGGDLAAKDVYTITLDPKINTEPEYVYGTFFWHMDGLSQENARPKATVLSARKLAPKGGQTEFASTYAAYEALPEAEKAEYANLRVMHSVVASVREIAEPEGLHPSRRYLKHEHPLVYTDKTGRKSLLAGYTADYVIGMEQPEGRALLVRLMEWASQPEFCYRHEWQEGDLVIWDNCGAMHRVIPYDRASGRRMHRTSVASFAEAA